MGRGEKIQKWVKREREEEREREREREGESEDRETCFCVSKLLSSGAQGHRQVMRVLDGSGLDHAETAENAENAEIAENGTEEVVSINNHRVIIHSVREQREGRSVSLREPVDCEPVTRLGPSCHPSWHQARRLGV